MRLLTVADQSLAAARESVDGFITVLRTVEDTAEKGIKGKERLTTALAHADDAVAAVNAARTAANGADGAAAALATLDDTKAGVEALRQRFSALLQGGNGTGPKVKPLELQGEVEASRGAIAASRDALRPHAGDQIAEGKVFTEIGTQTKAAQIPGVIDERVDSVTARAAELASDVGRMPTLEEVGVDMIAAARAGKYDSLVGREDEINQMLTILQRKRKANPVLLGDAGVGKTQLVEGLAKRVADGEVPEHMRNLKIYAIDGSSLKAAAGAEQGAMEKLVKAIVDEVSAERARGENVALFVDEMHTLMGAGDTANQLKPALARGDISLIGATTWDEFNRFVAKDDALKRRLAEVSVEELSKPKVLAVLRSLQEGLSGHHGTVAYDSALEEIQTLSSRYVRDRKQPDPAIELFDHALSRVSNNWKTGIPTEMQELANDVGRLKATIPRLERQAAIGDLGIIDEAGTAGKLVSARNQLAELEPKLAAMTTQLEREQEVLGTRFDLVRKYLSLAGEGTDEALAEAEALRPQLDQANAAVRALREEFPERMLNDMLDVAAVREAAANLYDVTISAGGADEAARALRLGDELRSRVIGQHTATDAIAETMIGIKSGMKDPDAPAGVFMFLGPTGVGKTETVRAVTEIMTDDVRNMIRIDGGEYMEQHNAARLFGAPPGYVGFDGDPKLAELIKKPEAHVLIDEADKMHPKIFQQLLALLEEGRAELGNGQSIDARGATFYLTMNLPEEQLTTRFSPEFLNRFDLVTKFDSLDMEDMGKIFDLQLPKVVERAKSNGLEVTITDAAKARIVEYGYDPAMGARPLKRSLKNHITNPSGRMILEMQTKGRTLDAAIPQQATLDVAESGNGFVMRSADGEISVPIAAQTAAEHTPVGSRPPRPASAASAPGSAGEQLDWNPNGPGGAGAGAPIPAAEPQPTFTTPGD